MNKKGFTLIEMLGVVILLAIILGIAVVSYSSYLNKSKNKTFKIEEKSFLSATKGAFLDCSSNNPDNDFCKTYGKVSDNKDYAKVITLKELIDDNYIDRIKNPYNTNQFCDEDKSYVFVGNRTMDGEINTDVMYSVCLVCGDHKSEGCLDEDFDNSQYSFDTTCDVTYDSIDGEKYNGEWTDRNLVLNFGVTGEYKYGIKQFAYGYTGSACDVCPSGGTLSKDGTKCIKTESTSTLGEVSCTVNKMCRKVTLRGTISINGSDVNCYSGTGELKSTMSDCYSTCDNICKSISCSSSPRCLTTQDFGEYVCGSEKLKGDACNTTPDAKKSCVCSDGSACDSNDMCVTPEVSYPANRNCLIDKTLKVVKLADNEKTYSILFDKNTGSLNYYVTAKDGLNITGSRASCGSIKIDKGKINSVTLSAKTSSTNRTVTSGELVNESVKLTAAPNPSSSTSGYLYQWYKDGVKYGDKTISSTLTTTSSGTYHVVITNRVGKQTAESNKIELKIDTVKPTCELAISEGIKFGEVYTSNVKIIFDKFADNDGGSGLSGKRLLNNKEVSEIVITDNGKDQKIEGTVYDNAGNYGTCSVTITKDDTTPEISAINDSNNIFDTDTTEIIDYFNVSYGVSGGNTVCKVGTTVVTKVSDLTLGINTVTCTATGNNGKDSSASTKFIHQYYADASCSTNGYNINDEKTSCTKTVEDGTLSCSSGQLSGTQCILSEPATFTGYSCSSGTVSGSQCIYDSSFNQNVTTSTTTTCDSTTSWTAEICSKNGGTFTQNSNTTVNGTGTCKYNCKNVTSSTCPDGYTKSGTVCTKNATAATANYSCPYAYALYDTVCKRWVGATPNTKTDYKIPTYTCSTTGINTSDNTTVSAEASTVACPNNRCASVPVCTFKEA